MKQALFFVKHSLRLYLNDIVFKSITLHTVHGRRIFETWENCEKLVAEGMYISFG